MIVRIAGEGQYRVGDADAPRLDQLDDAVVEAVNASDRALYVDRLAELMALVRSGERVGDDHLGASALILPPADLTLEEAAAEFTGEGLIPD